MLPKKQTGTGISFITCPNCKFRCPHRSLKKHLELECSEEILPILYPATLVNNAGVFELGVSDDAARLGHSLRRPEFLLFLNSAILSEMKLRTLDWVRVTSKVESQTDKTLELGPVMMQVWGTQWGSPYKAHVHPSALSSHPKLYSGKGTFIIDQILTFPVPIAKDVTFSIPFKPNQFSETDLRRKFQNWFESRLLCLGSAFVVQFLTHHIFTTVCSVSDARNSLTEVYMVTKNTQIQFTYQDNNFDETKVEGRIQPSMENVGGLDAEAKELSNTLFCSANAHDSGINLKMGSPPRGILIYGQHGTGKSLLVKALCNTHKINLLLFNEFPKTNNLRSKFQAAASASANKYPSVILIENLDNLCSSRRDESQGFAHDLRSQMDSLLPSDFVMVLATATNPDLIDPLLRSPHVFGKEIEIPIPSKASRLEILRKILKTSENNLTSECLRTIAQQTHGFVGADLEGLSILAFRLAAPGNPSLFHFNEGMKSVTPSAMKSIQLEIPDVRWEDIGGLEDLKFQLKQSIEWPIRHPEAFERLGLTPPKGLLMYGPPGCSKTMIAKALATESRLNFLSVKGSDLFSKWVGESEKSVQALFRKARQVAPAILFFDELDALGSERGSQGSGSNVHERVLAQLLTEIDGIESLKDVTIVGATNRPDLIDSALTRPGRLDRIIFVPLPDSKTREEIFRIKLRKMPLAEDVSLEFLVSETEGYSGAEITGICQEAGLKALEGDLEATVVRMEDFIGALAKSPRRITPQLLSFYKKYAEENERRK